MVVTKPLGYQNGPSQGQIRRIVRCRPVVDTVSELSVAYLFATPGDQMQSNSDISRLRVLVGYLGEHHQANWWSSSFLGRSSEAFLTPIFGNAVANARVVGVTEATRRVPTMPSGWDVRSICSDYLRR
jgi:hypothetical protein